MGRDTEELIIKWLDRRPMRKEGMNCIGIGNLEHRQLQVADMFCQYLARGC